MQFAALTLGTYLALGLLALVVGFFIVFIIVCLCEKQFLAGDVEPACEPFPYPPHPYWTRTREDAIRLGLRHAGDFATRRNSSMVKGLESLFFTPDQIVLVSVVAGSTAGAKLKKTVLRTRLDNGQILESTDAPINRDVTGGIKCAVLMNAGIEELLAFHRQRILNAGCLPVKFSSQSALAEADRIQLERGQRLVDCRMANWADREQTTIRLTLCGALALSKDMLVHMNQLEGQQARVKIKRVG